MKVKGYSTFDKLKTCLVGRTYNKEQFTAIKNQKVKDILFKILDETEEDYRNLCDVLQKAGVETLRPDVVDTEMTKGLWEDLPKLTADEVAEAVRYCFESTFNINKIVMQKNVG